MSSAAQAVRAFYSSLIAGESTGLIFMFGGPPKIDSPLEGSIEGSAALQSFVARQKSWLAEREAAVDEVAFTETAKTAVVEIQLSLTHDNQQLELPVALVADIGGGMVTWLRIYHCTWALIGSPKFREPLLKRRTRLGEPAVVKSYLAGMRKGDKEKLLSLFAEEGYVREPAGASLLHTGGDALDRFYSITLPNGGVDWAQCSATFDGQRCAIEYNCDCAGNATLPPQTGCAVYEIDSDERLSAVRIYDDLTTASES